MSVDAARRRSGFSAGHRITFSCQGLAFFLFGISLTVIGPMLQPVREEFAVSNAVVALIFLVSSAGHITGSLAGSYLSDIYGRRPFVIAGPATLGIGLLGAGLAPGFELFLLAGAVFGFGLGMLDGPTNALAVDIAGASSARILNMIHSAFGLGAVAGPLLSALVYSQTGDWRPLYIGLAIACLAAAVPFAFVTMPARVARQPGAWRFSKVINPHIVVIMAVMFCAVGVEMIYQSWLPSYLELDRGVERTIAAASLTLVSVGLIAGRILMAVAASRWDNYKVLTIAFGLCAIAAAGVMLPIGPIAALAFIGLASMFVAGGFPMAIAIGTRQAQGSIGAATGLIVAAAGIGGLIIPPGSGLLVERDRFDLVMQLPVAIALLGAVCVLYAGSISRRDRQIAI